MNVFVSPKHKILVLDNYARHKELKEELLDVLENYRDVQNRETNVKATMTEWLIDSWEIKNLKCKILSHSDNLLWKNSNCEFIDFWGNIYRKGDYTESHNHWLEHLSVVYFLKAKFYHAPLIFESIGLNKKIRPKEGRLVIFPSFLTHSVPIHKFDETRITLAANLRATGGNRGYFPK